MNQETKTITVKDLLKSRGKMLGLKLVVGAHYLSREIRVSEINRPGLAIAGHLEQFRPERIQIIGQGEHAFCKKDNYNKILASLTKMLAGEKTPCIVITGGLKPHRVFREAAKRAKVPLLATDMDTSFFVRELTMFLDDKLAAITYLHGVLVNVYGMGVLIRGNAGIGKSECALELLKRGHIFIADDIVEIRRRMGYMLVGRSPKNIQHYMEVRGLGIIDIELLFGIGAIMDQAIIEMQVYLDKAPESKNFRGYDRTGLDSSTVDILNISVPLLNIPVTPGRNLAVLIEVASLNQRLKNQGYNASQKLNASLLKRMKFRK